MTNQRQNKKNQKNGKLVAQVAAAVAAQLTPPPVQPDPQARKTRTMTPCMTVTPAAPGTLKNGKPCDDELTLLVDAMNPKRRAFADAVLRGETGAQAAIQAGFSVAAAKQRAYELMRRDDVRRYIRLHQSEASRSTRVTLSTLIDRLWLMTCDPTVGNARRDQSLQQLVRIFLAAAERPVVAKSIEDSGLSEEVVQSIEEKFLGVSA